MRRMFGVLKGGQRRLVPRDRRRLVCMAAIACGVLPFAACGSNGDTANRKATPTKDAQTPTATATPAGKATKPAKKKKIPKCGPTQGSPTSLTNVRTVKFDRRFNVDLSKLNLGSGNAKLSVVGTLKAGKKLTNTITRKGSFKVKKGRFVGIVYRVTNGGAKAVPVSKVVSPFRLVANNKAYPFTDALPKCGPISASLATSPDLPSSLKGKVSRPGAQVKPDETVESMLVYTLPGKTSPDAWFSPRFEVAVDLSKAPTIK